MLDDKASPDHGASTETMFGGCQGLPEEMKVSLDLPWVFLGEVTAKFPADHVQFIEALCRNESKCNPRLNGPFKQYLGTATLKSVSLRKHGFITNTGFEVSVFFGVCKNCGTVYWARQGPPFSRVSSCVHS